MNRSEDELRKLFENFNNEQLREKLTQGEIAKVKELLPKIEEVLRVHDRAKWIIRIIYYISMGVPILVAAWQAIERIR